MNINQSLAYSNRRTIPETNNEDDNAWRKEDPKACLFVGSLNSRISEQSLTSTLTSHFASFGSVKSVKVLKDASNRPYAFVQFHAADEAEKAMEASQNTVLDNRRIRIERARVNRSLFIARLSKEMEEKALEEILSGYGPIDDLYLVRDESGRSRGVAYVTFRFREDAMGAFQDLRGYTEWIVDWKNTTTCTSTSSTATNFERHGGEGDGSRIVVHVGNLNPRVNTDEIFKKFMEFGTVIEVSMFSKTSKDKTFAIADIKFSSVEFAEKALNAMNGATWKGYTMKLHLKKVRTGSRMGNRRYQSIASSTTCCSETSTEMTETKPLYDNIIRQEEQLIANRIHQSDNNEIKYTHEDSDDRNKADGSNSMVINAPEFIPQTATMTNTGTSSGVFPMYYVPVPYHPWDYYPYPVQYPTHPIIPSNINATTTNK